MAIALQDANRYDHRMRAFMTLLCLVLLGLSLAGCTKCGWIWQDGPRACHSDAPR